MVRATATELRSVLFRAREYIEAEPYLEQEDRAGRRDAVLREIHTMLTAEEKGG